MITPRKTGRLPFATNAQHVVIIGDSNAYGFGDTDNLDDKTLITAFPSVQIDQLIGTGDPFSAEYTITPEDLQPFAAGGVPGMGVELSMGRTLHTAGRTATKISKFASRGSSLGVEWIPSAAKYWSDLTTYLDAQVIAFGTIGVIYMDLGTNDSTTAAKACAWQKNATELVNALRALYGNFRLIVRMTSRNLDAAYPFWETVRQQQLAFANDDIRTALLNIDDTALSTDNLHFSANNYYGIGHRAAVEVLAAMGIAPPAFAGAFPEYLGAMPGVSGAGALTPLSFPCPLDDGYFEILVVATGLIDGATKATLSTANGFVEIGSQVSQFTTLDQWMTIFYRRATGRRMSNPVVADNNNYNAAKIFAFRQPTTTSGSPIDVSVFSKNDAYATPISITGATTTVNNCLIAAFGAFYGGAARTIGAWANGTVGSLTKRMECDYAIGSDHEIISLVTGTLATAGATGAFTATASAQMMGSHVTLGIKP